MMQDRPVDQAMNEDRPAKNTVRNLWVNVVKNIAKSYPNSDVPWYLTLSGGEGKDINLIISQGLISLTEVNSIALEDQDKIVAVERSNLAISNLQRKFVGLKIKEVDFRELVRGEGEFAWPQGEDINICRARVINLDLNEALKGRRESNQRIVFPVLEWIKKLCHIHAKDPRLDWTLCLTLHGAVNWTNEVNTWMINFIRENFKREPEFAEKCRGFFGTQLFDRLLAEDVEIHQLDSDQQLKFVMAIVPKILARLVHNDGWQVETAYNLRYGGGEHAEMLTWVIHFVWDENSGALPDAIYHTSLRKIFDGLGRVTDNGKIEQHVWQ